MATLNGRHQHIQQIVVTADQMRQVEERVFAAGMPVAALMEKVAGLIACRIGALHPNHSGLRVGVLVGTGHNGGDALVVARELHFRGYEVVVYQAIANLKELTGFHAQYCLSLGIPFVDRVGNLKDCGLLIDGLFGFGLERPLAGDVAAVVDQINQWSQPVISLDVPSGLHTNTGQVLGTAVRATRTLCLGLWKLGLLQDHALEYVGKAELVDFDLPLADVLSVVGEVPGVQRITPETAIAHLPLSRPATTHKYKMGHLLLICGSRRYAGGAILTGLGARASGVGMLSIAVPESLKPILTAQLPEALVMGCPETDQGAIAHLPDGIDLSAYHAIACGPGLTLDATPVVQVALESDRPLVLDADGLNILGQLGTVATLQKRTAPTVLTPHLGEFKRLFPDLAEPMNGRVTAVRTAAQQTGAIVLLKGARTAIADSQTVWINPESTPALARGGSGDVLTGLVGGLLAQAVAEQGTANREQRIGNSEPQTPSPVVRYSLSSSPLSTPHSPFITSIVQAAAWWHSEAGVLAVQERTELGVDAHTLTQYLIPALQHHIPFNP